LRNYFQIERRLHDTQAIFAPSIGRRANEHNRLQFKVKHFVTTHQQIDILTALSMLAVRSPFDSEIACHAKFRSKYSFFAASVGANGRENNKSIIW
jgi:hypothetical protein